MKIPQRRGASYRKDHYTTVFLVSLIISMVFRIPLRSMIGDKGIAYFSIANELYLVVAGMLCFGLSEAVAVLVRYRAKREQMRSVRKVISGALALGSILGALVSVAVFVFGNTLARHLCRLPMAGMAITFMAPAMVFYVITGALRGYFRGNGLKMAAMHSMILHALLLFIGGLVGAALFHDYGEKVSALLQNADYASAYGAVGASLGLLVTSLLCFFHMLVLYLMFKNRIASQMGRELSRSQDTNLDIFRMIFLSGGFYSIFYLIFYSRTLLDQHLLYRFSSIEEGLDTLWGVYYGKYLVVTGVLLGCMAILCLLPVKRVVSFMDREEYRGVKLHLGALLHQCAVITIPAAVFMAVFSENIFDLIYQGNNKDAAGWLQLGSVSVVFALFAIVFIDILCKSGRQKAVVAVGGVALMAHIGVVLLLLSTAKLSVKGLIAGEIVFWAILAVAGFLLVCRITQYVQEWIRSFAITIVAAAVCGLLLMVLNKAIISIAGNVVSLLICLPVGIIIYLGLLLSLKAFREEELELMVLGRVILNLARKLRLM